MHADNPKCDVGMFEKENVSLGRSPLKILTLCGLTVFSFASRGQSVIGVNPMGALRPPGSTPLPFERGTSDLLAGPWDVTSQMSGYLGNLRYGPFWIHPRISYQFLHGTGLARFQKAGESGATELHTFSPGVAIELGDHWNIDYEAGLHEYVDPTLRDNVSHTLALTGRFTLQDWVFSFRQGYSQNAEILVDTAAQTTQQIHTTALSTHYSHSETLSYDFGVNQMIRLSPTYSDYSNWSTMEWINYALAPKVSTGLGFGIGYSSIGQSQFRPGVPSTSFVSEQVQGRVVVTPSDKVSLSASGGLEFQQTLRKYGENLVNPVFSLTASYQPLEQTVFSISGSRALSGGYFAGESSQVTAINLGVRQRLLGKLHLDLAGGYQQTEYQSLFLFPIDQQLFQFQNQGRNRGLSFQSRLSATLFQSFAVGVFYRYSENESNSNLFGRQFSYNSSQVGVDVGIRF